MFKSLLMSRRALFTTFIGLAFMACLGTAQAQQKKIRILFGEALSTDTLPVMIALERAKEKGVDSEVTFMAHEELVIQAVINGQADLGIGTPYAVIQKSKAPLRLLFQGTRLVFFPVVDKSYKTWKDLNGQPFVFQGRGSGTEAIGNIIAKKEGIQFGERSYVPGSENRIIAMMKGQIKATIVDLANKNTLMEKGGDKFRVLPSVSSPATDDAIFGNLNWIKSNEKQVDIIVTELLRFWQEMNVDPSIVERERVKRNLMADQPKEVLTGITKFFTTATKEGVYAPYGGSAEIAKSDIEFYVEAGQLKGPAANLKIEDFWYLAPIEKAHKALGK